MIDLAVVNLSRLQFAATVLYHFLFVPLTLGMTFLLAVMESIYVVTGKQIYKDMTKFWGKLFGINFALGVTTGITMEFQFGMNWSYYSHYVGDIFGAPLAIEALMAFFLESTLVGLFIFGWDRMSKIKHLIVTWGVAFGTNLSALWILVANGWMQSPFGSKFNPDTMRMELANFSEVFLNPIAQVKFLHTVLAGYITGAIFIMAISSYYLLKKKDIGFAKRSFTVASIFGFFAACMVIVVGDESGYELHKVQPSKLAAIEAEWHTEKAPADLTLFALPSFKDRENHYAIKIPYLLGVIGTRTLDKQIIGINDLIISNEQRIKNGIYAVDALNKIREGDKSQIEILNKYQKDLGYGMLLKKYTNDVTKATEENIKNAAIDSVPNNISSLFFTFRIMVFCGFTLLLVFFLSLVFIYRRSFANKTWFLKLVLCSLPLPWIAIECGWWVAEYGRQPWAVFELLPVFIAASNLTVLDVLLTLLTMTLIYSVLAVVEVYLMQKYARIGPSSIRNGSDHFEQSDKE